MTVHKCIVEFDNKCDEYIKDVSICLISYIELRLMKHLSGTINHGNGKWRLFIDCLNPELGQEVNELLRHEHGHGVIYYSKYAIHHYDDKGYIVRYPTKEDKNKARSDYFFSIRKWFFVELKREQKSYVVFSVCPFSSIVEHMGLDKYIGLPEGIKD